MTLKLNSYLYRHVLADFTHGLPHCLQSVSTVTAIGHGIMSKSVLHRFTSTSVACHQLCLHLTASSSPQLFKRTSDGAAMSTIRRGMSRNALGANTNYFQYFWQPCSGHFAEGVTKVSKANTSICHKFGLSHKGMYTSYSRVYVI